MKPKILAYQALPPDVIEYLRRYADVVTLDDEKTMSSDTLAAALKEVDGAIGAKVNMTPAMLEGATRLKAFSTISAGFDKFDVDDLTRRGIALAHTPDVLTESTADAVFALILACARRVVEMADWVRAGQWERGIGEAQFGVDVQGRTIGIVGLGRIGGSVARRAALGFGMRVLYTNRHPNEAAERAYGAQRVGLAELLGAADFVCLHVPLTDQTRHLIGAAEFQKMKKSSILINVSRGAVVDEDALIEALHAGVIRGAGLDVFEREPLPTDSPLLKMKNVVALPHIGSATHETRQAMARCAAENLIAALAGTLTRNIVNREALSRR